LFGAALRSAGDERKAARIVPRLPHGRAFDRQAQHDHVHARGGGSTARREESKHDRRISRSASAGATCSVSLEDFRARARRAASETARLVPVWRDVLLDADTPVAAFAKLRNGPFAFLLESAPAGSETWSRYTFLGSAPRAAWRLLDGEVQDWTPQRGWHGARRPADPLDDLDTLIRARTPVEVRELGTFWTGAVGFFAYDVVRLIERLPSPPKKAVPVPDALFVFTDALVIIDNLKSQARVVVGAQIDDDTSEATLRAEYDRALAEVERTIAKLRTQATLPPLDLRMDAKPAEGISNTACQRPSRPSRSHQSGPTNLLRIAAISGASHVGMWTPLVTEPIGTWVSLRPRHASFHRRRETAPCSRLTPTDWSARRKAA